MSKHSLDLLALTLVPGLGIRNVKQLISYCGAPENVFNVPRKKLESIPGFGRKLVDIIKNHGTHTEAEAILKKSENKGMKVLNYLEPDYPQRLKSVIDSPVIIYTKGQGSFNPSKTVAIVGTRKATEYGKEVTRKIVRECADLNVQVISGLAYGIDIESHREALKAGTSTVAVIAGGLDRIYPSVHRKYAEEMQETGAIISECQPNTKPDPHLFPARNRIIAGMADAVIVVEAAARGGALITAKIADSYNRPLFAVPGNIDHSYSEGTNHLIATQMALIYTGIKDLKYQMSWDAADGESSKVVKNPNLEGEELAIYTLMKLEATSMQIDEIAIKGQLPINKVASLLLSLEFKGLVKNLPGKKFGLI